MVHPELPTCEMCKRFLYDVKNGWQPVVRGRGSSQEHHSLRPPGAKTPCEICPKIPKGSEPIPANAVELTEDNWNAWRFHKECKAVGSFPTGDPIVRRNAALIEDATESWERLANDAGAVKAMVRVLKQ